MEIGANHKGENNTIDEWNGATDWIGMGPERDQRETNNHKVSFSPKSQTA